MRNSLVTAALVVLLALTADVERPAAQLFPFELPAPQTLAPTTVPSTGNAGKAKVVTRSDGKPPTRPDGKPHKRLYVAPSQPNQRRIAEKKGYKRVSDLVNFPKFFPSLGILFVKPDSLPLGPFLCFDRRDRLVASVYMVPTKEIDDHKSLEAPGFAGTVDHVSIYFNPGHPGVNAPHYHVVIWHVTRKEEARVAK
ncbi:hypothetical protein NLM33_05260 [Bradyrhizobium sp. CCGUVB1N3]|uniref:hypothetical protein n=1 Tax=Bradyrhizobium sp. CCGUVB1N3 TaxID=2949629 RepID=UPI0020B2AFDB|nr:hypothetical protein [Bradyrhizobium sp. CCGUVB1N3]MCP3469737.1 hypothetical protein [Bradyrhizobium sp. CCGUVB1N3]